ncbi:sensor histidine kinase [Erythrobacter donghaensis]|uniref:sensor histidine kinase n=1 Tax=Erythrobacter donghaensis TaxID=267135 RepID=UPI000A3C1839|nr:sensor histidine kinase [Erythrobacter donghaensis]
MTIRPFDLRLLYLPDPAREDRGLVQALAEKGFDVTAMPGLDRGLPEGIVADAGVVLMDGSQLPHWRWRADDPPVVVLLPDSDPGAAADVLEVGASDWVAESEGPDFVRLVATVLLRAAAADRTARGARTAADDAAVMRERAETLFTEIRHRIANSMALVVSVAHLQSAMMPPGPGRRALDDFADRVLAIAQVHKGLYTAFNVGAVALDAYLGGVARELQRKHVGRRALSGIVFEGDPITGSVDTAISLGVVLSELVSNAARHAYGDEQRGEVRVTLRRVSALEAALIVEDDGAGVAHGEAFAEGLGSQLVAVLAHGVGGHFTLRPRERGTTAVLTFSTVEP